MEDCDSIKMISLNKSGLIAITVLVTGIILKPQIGLSSNKGILSKTNTSSNLVLKKGEHIVSLKPGTKISISYFNADGTYSNISDAIFEQLFDGNVYVLSYAQYMDEERIPIPIKDIISIFIGKGNYSTEGCLLGSCAGGLVGMLLAVVAFGTKTGATEGYFILVDPGILVGGLIGMSQGKNKNKSVLYSITKTEWQIIEDEAATGKLNDNGR
jgi:hypothetical protein